jgi:hypothetical protein
MAIITVKKNNNNFADYSVGWKTLKITSAERGMYDNGGSKYIDVFFEGYPENCKLRLHEKHNKRTKEEFNITRAFRYANAGIKEISEGESDYRVNIEIEPIHLVGTSLTCYFYKNKKGYSDISDNVLPGVPFKNEIEEWTSEQIEDSKDYVLKTYILPWIPNQDNEEVEDEWTPTEDKSDTKKEKDPWD